MQFVKRLNCPDGKTQVTVEYVDGKPVHIDTIVISTQHSPEIKTAELRNDIIEQVIKPILPDTLYDNKTKLYINPTGRFVIGGPQGDAGLTGRKIIVDTYGGPMQHAMWRKTLLRRELQIGAKFSWHMRSA